ncbi:glycine betaine/L-proline ABC transporter substrate-binding protein ProX [Photobacterium satsumensis]|uniref:glycine betaine/L-proline ABC transporter substrate-binding protein ProX n=1 Tax=Photobacterium satsumensis TaxID=2910239 RepID=UPI003D11A945
MHNSWKKLFTASILATAVYSGQLLAAELPGKGVPVAPVQSTIAEETFQTLIVSRALEELGYDVQPIKEIDINLAYTSMANGDATFYASAWFPLHADKYTMSGGDDKFYREGVYVEGAAQGYLIDKKTADQYGITNIGQLKDPKLAKLFDANSDGKANLAGCNPGWGCEGVIETQLDAYKLRDTVGHDQGNYAAIIADTISRYRKGESILYYAWTPHWVSGVLVPGKDVVWLEVPFSALPGERSHFDTTLANGKNYGFEMNVMRIVANKEFAENNPAAAKLFEVMNININDISAQNMMMSQGKNSSADIQSHANGWIVAHQDLFDSWLDEARKAAL